MKTEVKERAYSRLKKALRPGSTVYTVLRSVSQSGMSRKITMVIARKGKVENIDWEVSHVLDYKRDPSNGALKVGGCGMDMGFHLVYSLGRRLYPNGFKLAKGQFGRNGSKSRVDSDGGYAFNHQWI